MGANSGEESKIFRVSPGNGAQLNPFPGLYAAIERLTIAAMPGRSPKDPTKVGHAGVWLHRYQHLQRPATTTGLVGAALLTVSDAYRAAPPTHQRQAHPQRREPPDQSDPSQAQPDQCDSLSARLYGNAPESGAGSSADSHPRGNSSTRDDGSDIRPHITRKGVSHQNSRGGASRSSAYRRSERVPVHLIETALQLNRAA